MSRFMIKKTTEQQKFRKAALRKMLLPKKYRNVIVNRSKKVVRIVPKIRPAKQIVFSRLPYGIQMNIFEKLHYSQFVSFNECSQNSKKLCNMHQALKFPEDSCAIVVQHHNYYRLTSENDSESKSCTTCPQLIFNKVHYIIREPLTDDLCSTLIRNTKKCSIIELSNGRFMCSKEMFSKLINETNLECLRWFGPLSQLIGVDAKNTEILLIGSASVEDVFAITAKKVAVFTDSSAFEIMSHLKVKLVLTSTQTEKVLHNKKFTEATVTEAMLLFGESCHKVPMPAEMDSSQYHSWLICSNLKKDPLVYILFDVNACNIIIRPVDW